jgi:hypothetical protein
MPNTNQLSTFVNATQTADGNASWSNVSDALVQDSVSATVFVDYPAQTFSNYLKLTERLYKIPDSATINGIIARFYISQETGLTLVRDYTVYLLKGATLSTPKVNISNVGLNAEGNTTDLWGLSWTAADINAADFGFQIKIDNGGSDVTWGIDYVETEVYYTYTETGDGTGRTTQGRRALFTAQTNLRIAT